MSAPGSLLQDGPNASTRHLLARLDVAITELESEQRRALAVEREAKAHATEVGRIKAELMDVRRELRPVLDPSAPREYPYDKR